MPTEHDELELDDELRAIASALVADAPAVPELRRIEQPRQPRDSLLTRRGLLAAASLVVVVGVAGVYWVGREGSSGRSSVPTEPGVVGPEDEITWPALLPISDDEHAYGFIHAWPVDDFRVAQATIATRVDGALRDPVLVEVGTDYGATHNRDEPVDIVGVFGRTARVYTSLDDLTPLTVVIGDDPYVAVSSVDPMSFLNRVDEDFVRHDVPDDGGPITLEFGDLPEGYEVVSYTPEPGHVVAFVVTYLDALQISIITGTGPVMIGRDAEPVEVNDASGWLTTDGAHTEVTWQVGQGTFTGVHGNEPGATLELARSLRWVPLDEWAEHYDVDVEAIEPGPPVRF